MTPNEAHLTEKTPSSAGLGKKSWPVGIGKTDETGAVARVFKFSGISGDEALKVSLRLKRTMQEQKNVPIAKLIKESALRHGRTAVAEAYVPYENMTLAQLIQDNSTMAKDLLNIHTNVRITGLRIPPCRQNFIDKADKVTRRMLDAALEKAALRMDVEDIQNAIQNNLALEGDLKKRFESIDGKEIMAELEKDKGFGANKATREKLMGILKEKAAVDPESSAEAKEAITKLAQVIGERIKAERKDGFNQTLALAAFRNEIPEEVYEKCFGHKRQQN